MKSLIVIWILVLVTIIGGGVYMSNAINELIQAVPETQTSAVIRSNEIDVVNNYQEQKTANINVLEPKVSDVYLQYGAYTQTQPSAEVLQGSSNIAVK